MIKEIASKIAEEFLNTMNPGNWDGVGEKPIDFNTRMFFYEVRSPYRVKLSLSYEWQPDTKDTSVPAWVCVCRLWDHSFKQKQATKTCFCLNSKDAICDLIVSVCKS